jgi:hypothetical protein
MAGLSLIPSRLLGNARARKSHRAVPWVQSLLAVENWPQSNAMHHAAGSHSAERVS